MGYILEGRFRPLLAQAGMKDLPAQYNYGLAGYNNKG